MSKKVWITMLSDDPVKAKEINAQLLEYAIKPQGHFFKDDLEKMEWSTCIGEILNKDTGLWLICGKKEDLLKESILKGLSLTALAVQYIKGEKFPIIIVSDIDMEKESLPFAFQNAIILPFESGSIGVKAAAKVNISPKPSKRDFRLNIIPIQGSGIWIEVGPKKQGWKGILAGVLKPEKVDALGVGEKEKIPDKSVLEYPVRGMEIEINQREFYAWGAKNIITETDSAFFRIGKNSSSIIFGDFNDGEDQSVYIIDLC